MNGKSISDYTCRLLKFLGNEQICRPPHSTKVRFASFQSGGFITVVVVNPPESKLAKRISVHSLVCSMRDVFKYLVHLK